MGSGTTVSGQQISHRQDLLYHGVSCHFVLIISLHTFSQLLAGGLKQIVAEEGARGLYRGLGPQFVALLPNWAVRHSLVL